MQPYIESIGKTYGVFPAWVLMFLLVFVRYAVMASVFYGIFYVLFKQHFFRFKIQQKYPKSAEIIRELGYSLLTAAIFASMAFGVYALRKMGLGHLYFNISERGWAYYIFSLAFIIVLHDAYFYWIHRLMHHPRLFKHLHKVHHLSHNPTPYTAFAFHPLEAIIEFGIIPIIALFMPIHVSALLIFTIWSIFFNVMGHTGFEFAPQGATRHPFWKWLSTPTHHNMHHQQGNYNFSLYFNWWDRWMGTNNPRYDEVFDDVKKRALMQKTSAMLLMLIGFSGGIMAQNSNRDAVIDQQIEALQKGDYQPPETRAAQIDTWMKNDLQLRDDQINPIHDINLRYALRTERDIAKADISMWSKYLKIKDIQDEKDEELKRILDKSQFKKYAAFRDDVLWKAVRKLIF